MITNRWSPLMRSLQDEMDQPFASILGDRQWPGFANSYPLFNLWEDDGCYYADTELPGMPLDCLEIFVAQGNHLTIQGERKPDEMAATWHRQERGFGKFTRTIALPGEVNPDKVEARMEQGILRVTLPKSEKARARRIAVKAK